MAELDEAEMAQEDAELELDRALDRLEEAERERDETRRQLDTLRLELAKTKTELEDARDGGEREAIQTEHFRTAWDRVLADAPLP
jgi:peptidoglycan hydrolase CwlO-like protein